MPNMEITVEDTAMDNPDINVKVIKFSGQLDETNVDEKSKGVYEFLEGMPKGASVIFDFDELEYLNSKAVGYVTDWYSKITQNGGQVVIARVKDNIYDILNVVGITQIVKLAGTIDEAKLEIMKNIEHPGS